MAFDPAALAAPFAADAISWRAQSMKADGTSAMALAYIDARDVMRRLDEVCGPADWSDSYTETAKGRLICTLSIRIGDEWISKSDGAGDTDVEGAKGALSDALKRAAVKWGIGRYLYDLPVVWAECESYERGGKKQWKRWTPNGERKLIAAVRGAGAPAAIAAAPAPIQDDDGVPASVQAMVDGLEAASKRGEGAMTEYWVGNWPAIPREHRPFVMAQKERIKQAMPEQRRAA
jgi:hypothetical protein